jgi:hypothetical protein
MQVLGSSEILAVTFWTHFQLQLTFPPAEWQQSASASLWPLELSGLGCQAQRGTPQWCETSDPLPLSHSARDAHD